MAGTAAGNNNAGGGGAGGLVSGASNGNTTTAPAGAAANAAGSQSSSGAAGTANNAGGGGGAGNNNGKMPAILREFVASLDDREWQSDMYKLLQVWTICKSINRQQETHLALLVQSRVRAKNKLATTINGVLYISYYHGIFKKEPFYFVLCLY